MKYRILTNGVIFKVEKHSFLFWGLVGDDVFYSSEAARDFIKAQENKKPRKWEVIEEVSVH